jgi:hypothetical protein
MDSDKTLIEKLTDAVRGAANSVVDAASNAAENGIKANAARMSANDEQVAGTANEQIFIPEATDAAAMPIPFSAPSPVRKKRGTPAPANTSRKKAAAKRASPKKAKAKTGRKTVAKKKPVAKKKKAQKAKH